MKQFTSGDTVPRQNSGKFKSLIWFVALVLAPMSAHAQNTPEVQEPADAQKASPEVSSETVIALQKRVKSLEAQIVDLRTMIGTFSSMGQGPSQGGALSGFGDQDAAGPRQGPAALPWRGNVESSTQEDAAGDTMVSGPQAALPVPPKRPDVREDGFSSDRMRLGEGGTDDKKNEGRLSRQASSNPVREPENTDAQSLYKDAYSHMLRRDYASAESAFGALIKNHPQSRMAGNAQYWLGETYYVRGKYRPAADAFLKAYRNYSNGVKAPDSLMKLALSLTRLGQKAAACKTFDELDSKYPNAPSHVKQRAGMERRRAGCN
jgi:tol-pal system protein YbgF